MVLEVLLTVSNCHSLKVFLRWYHPDELNELVRPIAGAATTLLKTARGLVGRKRVRKLLTAKAEQDKKVGSTGRQWPSRS